MTVNWGPTGQAVYERTYSRTKADGTKENWQETVERVVDGNLGLVDKKHHLPGEREELIEMIYSFKTIPAGRHLWMSGVPGRQFLFNCYVAGWGEKLSEHFTFTFSRLIEGGGVGANYSHRFLQKEDGYPKYVVYNLVDLHIICSPDHPDYEELKPYLSEKYTHEYREAIEVEDSREGWTKTLGDLIDSSTEYVIHKDRPGNLDEETMEFIPLIVLDMSHVREAGRTIKTFGGTSAGPVPFVKMLTKVNSILGSMWIEGVSGPGCMDIDHIISECIVSGNVRRGARMSIMHWNDPEIEWFLQCKQGQHAHWSTNISVEIDDEFISYLDESQDENQALLPQKTLRARKVYRKIVEGMLTNGEPGIWNSSLANKGSPVEIVATNPCGEIGLEEWENCNLGHVNLSEFVDQRGFVDGEKIHRAHVLMTRFLIRATYGDITNEKTRAANEKNRRIGLGHFGLAEFLAFNGVLYSQISEYLWFGDFLRNLYRTVEDEADRYCYELRIPVPVALTTCAPTGTIAKMAGVSEGIHPTYATYYIRRVRYSKVDPDQAKAVEEFRAQGYNVVDDIYSENTWVVEIPTEDSIVGKLKDRGLNPLLAQSVNQISLKSMLQMQKIYQTSWADNSISFTINVEEGSTTVPEVMETLLQYIPYLKGTTIMVDESRDLAPYERISKSRYYDLVGSRAGQVGTSFDEECASGACPVR